MTQRPRASSLRAWVLRLCPKLKTRGAGMQTSQKQRAGKFSAARIVKTGWVLFLLLFTAACHLEMYDQPKYEALKEGDFFPNGSSARPLVANTVSREQPAIDAFST